MKPWDGVVSEEDVRLTDAAGFGRASGYRGRPALLVIDVQYRTVGTRRAPIREAMTEFPTACGEYGWRAVDNIRPLLDLFRSRSWPVLYPYVSPKESYDAGRLAEKNPAMMKIAGRGYDFVEEIAPLPGDVLLPKKHPSAFFGTPLASYLIDARAETLVVTGCTTSGCVRGSVVDGFAYNFRMVVPHDCVYDRSQTSHAVNLFDMAAKYAAVAPVAEVLDRLRQLE